MSDDGEEGATEGPAVFGAIDPGALRDIRAVFTDMEQLVESATFDDPFDPSVLHVELGDGIGAARTARFDVTWSHSGNYTFHYTDESGVDFGFDRHPKPGAPREHFHRPPDAPSEPVERSCISVTQVELVTRAVLKLWRDAYDRGTFDGLNEGENPP